jgi:chromosome segregation ATPase
MLGRLEAEAKERDLSLDEYIREIVRNRHAGGEETAALREELAAREARIEELETTLARRSQKVVDLQETVESLEEQLDAREDRIEELRADLAEQTERNEQLEEEVATLRERIEAREDRIDQLETQLAKRSQIEDRVEELSMEVREERELGTAPFIVRWWRWLRG